MTMLGRRHDPLQRQVKRMLRGAKEEEAKLQLRRRRRSGSFAESGGGGVSEEEDGPDERPRGLSRSLEARCAATRAAPPTPLLPCYRMLAAHRREGERGGDK